MASALKKILTEMSRIEGVRGVIVVSKDGMVLDAVVPGREIDAEDLGAAVSGIVNNMAKIGAQFELGDPRIMSLEYDDGMIVVGDLGENFVLVIADKTAMIGMIRNEIKRQRDKLKAIVG
ncbi:MAG: roadblock/LC7 domain-containing protein [Desulfurococcales archaeon]|nr:roadblock/LC7 domain-containing protein [Desulfurococcales archaeon]